jgi:hypothetical protein
MNVSMESTKISRTINPEYIAIAIFLVLLGWIIIMGFILKSSDRVTNIVDIERN